MTAPRYWRFWTLVIIAIFIFLTLQFGVGLYTDYLWFQHLGFESVFTTNLYARLGVGLAIAIPVMLLFWANIFTARYLSIRNILFFSDETLIAQKFVAWLAWLVGLGLGWLVYLAASANWLLFLRFINQQPFHQADPIFGQDVGFYIFTLPVLHFLQGWLLGGLVLSLVGAVAVYALAQQNNLAEGRLIILPHVQLHLSVLGGLIFLTLAWGHWLDLFDLMYSPRGVAFGASYTDVHVSMPALWVMITLGIATAIILLVNIVLRRPALSLLAIFIWIIVGVVGQGFIPFMVQRYIVEPNELVRETPYIEHNIHFTRLAYDLDKIEERDFEQVQPLTGQALVDNAATLQNLRLWDYRPLLQTYQQIQAIRLYYHFFDVDLDRYTINGQPRQVTLSARELDKSQLQSPTWLNQKLQFTHGYGAVMNPVNEATADGLPVLWLKDLPPQSDIGLTVTRPEIYFGEATDDYVFVKTRVGEFNYPSGDQNVYTTYEGTGGVPLDNPLKRLAFALRLADVNMLLSQDITPDSRVLLFRHITQRVERLAPFLRYDRDPYLVVGEDGRLYWLQDAYTTSDQYPYAEPTDNLNYIRNSVKVLTDAYNGTVTFYVTDSSDPLIQAYQAIFPALFTPITQMPDWLRAHLRYPVDLFAIQARIYQTYHMQDSNVFYNKEDLWQRPQETFTGQPQPMEPYYIVARLPGESHSEFALALPFTPNNKDNLVAWLAARSDGDHYGQLVVYRFPKQELVYGPLQIEGRIDQNPEISAQITLWDQSGSEVIRGNLLVLPVDQALLYVEPLYLRAITGQIPELKRVILVSGDRVVMRETLAQALLALFETDETFPTESESASAEPEPETAVEAAVEPTTGPTLTTAQIHQLALTASAHYEAAQQALRRGDWAAYGAELEKMQTALESLVEVTK
jgi:hypothetical protein